MWTIAQQEQGSWKKALFLCGVLFATGTVCCAQDPLQVLALPNDTTKVLKLSDLCFAYRRVNADSALLFGHMALDLSQKLGFAKGEAQACNDLSIIHMDRSGFAEADSLLHRALDIRTALKDSSGMGAIHNKLGNIYQSQSRYEDALAENFKALSIFERAGPPAKEAVILQNIAILQFNLRRYDASLATHERAAAIRQGLGDQQGVAESNGNMGNVHLHLGDTLTAIRLYEQAIGYFRTHDLQRELAIQLHNLAAVQLDLRRHELAEAMFTEALSIRRSVGERKAIASSLIGLGRTRLAQHRFVEAERPLREALRLSVEVNARSEEMQALLDLSRVFAHRNMGDSVLRYQGWYNALKDSVFNADLTLRTTEMEARYENEKKEREIQRQRADLAANDLRIAQLDREAAQRRFWLLVAIAALGLAVLAGVLLLQVQRRRARAARDAALLEERERGLKAMVDSTESERRRIAHELHDGVGQQISGLKFRLEAAAERDPDLRALLSIADDAGKEVRGLAHQMMPRALAANGLVAALREMLERSLMRPGMEVRFDHFGVEGRLPGPLEVGVYRIAQELVNNIIKHAGATEVSVQLLRNKGHLVLIVEDNGKGFHLTEAGGGLGLQGMMDRARLMHGTLTFATGLERGTLATLRVPLET